MATIQRKLWRDLRRQLWQFAAVGLIVLLGVALFGASYMAYQNLNSSYQYSYEQLKFMDFLVTQRQLPGEAVQTLETLPGVAATQGRLQRELRVEMPEMDAKRAEGRVISLPLETRANVNDVKIERGDYFRADSTPQVLVLKNFAEYHGLEPGDILALTIGEETVNFRVQGIATSPEYLWVAKSALEFFPSARNFGVFFMPEGQMAELFDTRGSYDQVAIRIAANADRSEVIERVTEVLSPYGLPEITVREKWPSTRMLDMDLKAFSQVAVAFPLLFLAVAAFVIYSLLTRLIMAQRPQIGLMKAVGYSQQQIRNHYLGFALVVGLSASLLGSALGYILSISATRLYVKLLGLPYLNTDPRWETIFFGLLAGLVVALLAGYFPARAALRLPPAEAMREAAPVSSGRPWLERVFPALAGRSFTWRLPFRSLFRSRWRSLTTILGTAAGIALILVGVSFFDAFDYAIEQQFERIQNYDLRLSFNSPRPESILEQIQTIDGINRAEGMLDLPVRLEFGQNSTTTLVSGLAANNELHGLYQGNKRVAISEEGILLTSNLRQVLGVKVGDEVSVQAPSNSASYRVVGFVDQPLGTQGFLPLDEVRRLSALPKALSALLGRRTAQDSISSIMINSNPEASAAVLDRLYQLDGVAAIQVMDRFRSEIDDLMALFNGFIGVMVIFGVALALAIVFNIVTTNILERRREIATMRTIGTPRSKVALMLTLENIITGLLGGLLGFGLGYLGAGFFIGIYNSDLLTMSTIIYPRTFVLTGLGLVLILLISELPGILSVNRMNLAEVTKEQFI